MCPNAPTPYYQTNKECFKLAVMDMQTERGTQSHTLCHTPMIPQLLSLMPQHVTVAMHLHPTHCVHTMNTSLAISPGTHPFFPMHEKRAPQAAPGGTTQRYGALALMFHTSPCAPPTPHVAHAKQITDACNSLPRTLDTDDCLGSACAMLPVPPILNATFRATISTLPALRFSVPTTPYCGLGHKSYVWVVDGEWHGVGLPSQIGQHGTTVHQTIGPS